MHLLFLSLIDVFIAIQRVKMRVSQCGHNIPKEVVERRFVLGLNNFNSIYKFIVTDWILYESRGGILVKIDSGVNNVSKK